MTELLAAIPRLFNLHRKHDYARFIQMANPDQLAAKAIASTQRQMMDAYLSVIDGAEKTNHTSSAKG